MGERNIRWAPPARTEAEDRVKSGRIAEDGGVLDDRANEVDDLSSGSLSKPGSLLRVIEGMAPYLRLRSPKGGHVELTLRGSSAVIAGREPSEYGAPALPRTVKRMHFVRYCCGIVDSGMCGMRRHPGSGKYGPSARVLECAFSRSGGRPGGGRVPTQHSLTSPAVWPPHA